MADEKMTLASQKYTARESQDHTRGTFEWVTMDPTTDM